MYVNPFYFGMALGALGTLLIITIIAYYMGRKQ